MKPVALPKIPVFLAKILAHPACWFGLAGVTLLLDWLAGPVIIFSLAFIFPVVLAAWHFGFRWGVAFAVTQPLIRFGFHFFRDMPWTATESAVNLVIRMVMLIGLAWLIAHIVKQKRRIENLERLLPICAWCGKIRDDKNAWERLYTYLVSRTELSFTHTICQTCSDKELNPKR